MKHKIVELKIIVIIVALGQGFAEHFSFLLLA
jgi:hypothetical protein